MSLHGIVQRSFKASEWKRWEWGPDDASFSAGYGHVASFQYLVVALLEGGRRGARYPLLMLLSSENDFARNYTSSEAIELKEEIEGIRGALGRIEIPGISVEIDGEVFVSPIHLGASGEELPVYGNPSWETSTWELIVQRDGTLLFRDKRTGNRTRGRRFEWVGSGYVSDHNEKIDIEQVLGSRWWATEADASDYSQLMDDIVMVCNASLVSGNDIVFS